MTLCSTRSLKQTLVNEMNTQLLINAVVQQTMVFIARLATAGGVRAPLAHVASQVFLDLTRELQHQGVKKKVIADMFGMALRTYHRRVRELGESRTDSGTTLWEGVLAYLRDHEPASIQDVQTRFRHDDPELLTGVLNDLVNSGLAYRSGTGDRSVYRLADEADFAPAGDARHEGERYLVWLMVYRLGPLTEEAVAEAARLKLESCQAALNGLLSEGRIQMTEGSDPPTYESGSFEVPWGTSQGWEAAVLDHFQAMVSAIDQKLSLGSSRADLRDIVGGSTWSLDLWDGHPLEAEAQGTLSRVRGELEALRQRVDEHTQTVGRTPTKRVVCYIGQYVREVE